MYADRRELLVFRAFSTVSQRVEMVFRHAEKEAVTHSLFFAYHGCFCRFVEMAAAAVRTARFMASKRSSLWAAIQMTPMA